MNITLGPQWEDFITENVKTGRYQSASDVVLEGLRLLREKASHQPTTVEELQREVDKGLDALDQGNYRDLDVTGMKDHLEEVKLRGRARLARRDSMTK